MLKYSFMSKYSNCNKDEAIDLIRNTDKGFVYTYGLSYKGPATYRVPITRKEALNHAKSSIVDITEENDVIHINRYSGNDLF